MQANTGKDRCEFYGQIALTYLSCIVGISRNGFKAQAFAHCLAIKRPASAV